MGRPNHIKTMVVRIAGALLGLLACAVVMAEDCIPVTAPKTAARAVVVNVSPVKKMDIPRVINSLGSLSAISQALVSSDTDGRIVSILYTNGQSVGKNMPIIKLDDTQAKADYEKSVTTYQLAKTKYNSWKTLENEAVSHQELLRLKADMDNKYATMQGMQDALNQKTITSPISGFLGVFQVNVGDYVKAGSPLVTLTNINHLQAQYQIRESVLPQLKMGQLVTVTTVTYPGENFYGTVSYLSPTIDPQTRSATLQATIDNRKMLLRPGMFVAVSQKIGTLQNALVVAEESVLADIQGYYVYRVVSDHAVKTYIEEGESYHGSIVVLSGLKIGDSVVSAGQQKLEEGMLVKVENTNAK